tara:strand:+ start:6 stop:758 length:753 start_codon:yes stop_codon:yes gene_type:complete
MVTRNRFLSENKGEPEFSMLTTGNTSYRQARSNYAYGSPKRSTTPRKKNSATRKTYSTDEEFASYQKNYAGAGGGVSVNMTAEAAKTKANMTLQEEYKRYVQQTYPAMDYLSDQIENLDLTKGLREDVAQTFETRKGTDARNRARYGVDLTRAEQGQLQRNYQISQANTLAGGLTRGRRMTKDLQDELRFGQHDLSLQSYNQGMGYLTSGGTSAYQRQMAYQNAKSQHKAGMLNTAFNLGTSLFNAFGKS